MFVDPIAEGWFVDSPELLGADRFHPTNDGEKYLAQRIAPIINREGFQPLVTVDAGRAGWSSTSCVFTAK